MATNLSRYAVDKLFGEGLPFEQTGSGRGSEIRVDVKAALRWFANRKEPARALTGAPKPPPDLEFMADEHPVHQAVVRIALEAIYSSTWYAHHFAVGVGVDEKNAGTIGVGTSAMLIEHFERLFRGMGIEAFQPDDPTWLNPDRMWWRPDRGLREDLEMPAPEPAA